MTYQRQLRSYAIVGLPLEWPDPFLNYVLIRPGVCMADDGVTQVAELLTAATPALDVSGIGGLDTGVEAANTWYSVWVVSGASGVNGLLSLSSTSPVLPAGYDVAKRRVGWVYNDSFSNIRKFTFFMFGTTRYQYWDDENENAVQLVSAGTATAWTTVAASVWVPPTARYANILIASSAVLTANFCIAQIRPVGSTVADPCFSVPAYTRTTSQQRAMNTQTFKCFTGTGRNFQYQNRTTGAETDISVIGYYDQLDKDLT